MDTGLLSMEKNEEEPRMDLEEQRADIITVIASACNKTAIW